MALKRGDIVKFVNNKDLFTDWIWSDFKVPIVGHYYVVRSITAWGGILLEGVENEIYRDPVTNNVGEPGFSMDRFELIQDISKYNYMTLGSLRESELNKFKKIECKTVNDVLDKINREGKDSLTEDELNILKKGTK